MAGDKKQRQRMRNRLKKSTHQIRSGTAQTPRVKVVFREHNLTEKTAAEILRGARKVSGLAPHQIEPARQALNNIGWTPEPDT